jgi:hypothetical protein
MEGEADHTPPSSEYWSYTSIPNTSSWHDVSLIKHKDSFTFIIEGCTSNDSYLLQEVTENMLYRTQIF